MDEQQIIEHIKKTPGFHYHTFKIGSTIIRGHSDTLLRDRELPWSELSVRNKRVLDIGCSSGYFLCRAAQLGASSIVGIDRDINAVLATRFLLQNYVKHRNHLIMQSDFWTTQPYEKDAFDITFCLAVLHHLIQGRVNDADVKFDKAIERLAKIDSANYYLEIICNPLTAELMTYREGFNNNIPSLAYCLQTLRRHFDHAMIHCRMPPPQLPKGLHEGGKNGVRYLFVCKKRRDSEKQVTIISGPPGSGKTYTTHTRSTNALSLDGVLRETMRTLNQDDQCLKDYEQTRINDLLTQSLERFILQNACLSLNLSKDIIVEGYHFRYKRWRELLESTLRPFGYTSFEFEWLSRTPEQLKHNLMSRGEKYDDAEYARLADIEPEK
jgi:SAM-dependent methyltransferase